MIHRIDELKVRKGEIAICWLGQNSFILKTASGTIFSIDPYLSRDKKYSYVHPEPPIKPEDFKVHYIFCTHDHLDHTDPKSLPTIAKHSPDTIFFGPRESCKHLIELGVEENRVRTLEAEIPYRVRDLKITAYHSIPPEEADTTHFGYIFEVEEVKIYNMGDTSQSVVRKPEIILEPIMKESPDIAMLPIIGDTPQRRPEDAFLFAKLIKPKIVIPCHYDCFSDRTIDPQKFIQLFKETPSIRPIAIPYKGVYIYGSYTSQICGG